MKKTTKYYIIYMTMLAKQLKEMRRLTRNQSGRFDTQETKDISRRIMRLDSLKTSLKKVE